MERCHWLHVDQAIINGCSRRLHRWSGNNSLSHHSANNVADLADIGARSVCTNRPVSCTHSSLVSLSLSVFLSQTQAEVLYALKSGLSFLCVCVCVFTPLVIPVLMVSVALERRVISSFWGAHWNPGGNSGGERKPTKEEGWALRLRELLWHRSHRLPALNLHTQPSGVGWPACARVRILLCILSYSVRVSPFTLASVSFPMSMLYFSLSVPFCLSLLSQAQAFVLLGSETTKWFCLPLLLCALSCCFLRGSD